MNNGKNSGILARVFNFFFSKNLSAPQTKKEIVYYPEDPLGPPTPERKEAHRRWLQENDPEFLKLLDERNGSK